MLTKKSSLLIGFFLLMILVSSALLSSGVKKVTKENNVHGVSTNNPNIKGITLPHHEIAKQIIITSLEEISNFQQYKKIILISPNHYFPDSYTFTIDHHTEELLSIEGVDLIQIFPDLIIDDQIIEREHGIQNVKEYLIRYFPEAEYFTLATSLHYDPSELQRMAALLASLDEDTLYVVSVDFAHGYTQEQAIENNLATIEALRSFDYQTILNFDDKNLDTPVGTVLLLNIMDKLKATNWNTLYNSHTGVLEQDPTIQGTGYVIGVFSKE